MKMMEQIKDEYYKKNEKMGYSKEHDFDYATLSERMKDMAKRDVYAGEPELIAISHVVERPITVHQTSNELTCRETFRENAAPIHRIYTESTSLRSST